MANYFDEMGWTPLADGAEPDHLLHLARLLLDFGVTELFDRHQSSLPPPASKEAVQKLPDIVIDSKDVQCTICLKQFNITETAKQLPCEHLYHPTCIMPWLQKTNSCPLCRYELPTDDETYERIKAAKKREVERAKDLEVLHNSMFS